jgi:hypothetical protein
MMSATAALAPASLSARPTLFIFLGGALILGALAYRNWPVRRAAALP